jgi:hypothetical protein
MSKKGKLPIFNGPKVERAIAVASPSRAVIATENPIQRWDENTNQVVNEVLLMDGIVWRGGRDQIPIVDSHNDKTVRNIFGSIQHMKIDETNGELYGVPVFASDAESQTIMQRMSEGHITDFSITGQPLETLYVQRGQSYTTNRGVVIDGPALIHTKWQPQNASICATGADEQSTVRRSYTDLDRKVIRMNPELLAKLSAMGLPDGVTDPDQVLAWVIGKVGEESPEAEEPVMNMAEQKPAEESVPAVVPPVEKMASEEELKPKVMNQASTIDQIKRSLLADQARRTEIQSACKLARVERAFADELCDGFVSLSDARKRIIERMATQPLGSSVGADVRVTESGDDKFYAAARDGLILRSLQATGKRGAAQAFKPADGADDFKNLGLMRLAEQFLVRRGVNTGRMNNPDIAKLAMGSPDAIRRHRVERADFSAYHTTGSFANLMLDAANKTLLNSYEEAPYTWNMWARQGASVPDFKAINRIRFSESPNLEVVPERNDYPEKVMSDFRESYSVTKYGASFSVSWETIVNDDLDALSRIPAMHGNAARREQNRAVYSVLTSNAALSDTGALFNTTAVTTAGGHANQSASAAVISATTLNNAYVSMLTQKGLNTNVILNIQPRFLIVPAAISHTALQFVNSIADPGAGGNVAGNSNTLNIYGPQGMRNLQVIIEPQLDSSSASVWYLAADSAQIDTVELTFLQGEESPVLESEWNIKNDTWLYKIRQTFAAKAIDFRGLYRNA